MDGCQSWNGRRGPALLRTERQWELPLWCAVVTSAYAVAGGFNGLLGKLPQFALPQLPEGFRPSRESRYEAFCLLTLTRAFLHSPFCIICSPWVQSAFKKFPLSNQVFQNLANRSFKILICLYLHHQLSFLGAGCTTRYLHPCDSGLRSSISDLLSNAVNPPGGGGGAAGGRPV